MSWTEPVPTPVMPSSVSSSTIGTSVTPETMNPLTSPTGRPQSWKVRKAR